ncbi:hypothetical protein GCM10010172_39050 [Paractinoplanes ferrugineus]|uniref:Uncharacterized protein n=1 Tax=Paractinoplanes ferrugineus TaxID=113564 RepID=A0A919J8U5_9ACTN|nr:hypothetical protein [Actinoplanes ferrugineus]GIE12681.1 hypothetical protein Afe05nite_45210 [Actinoplanes ferrugineus]
MTAAERRRQAGDRARRRAVRALAAQLGVPYTVAARLIADPHHPPVFARREQRPFEVRVRDTRQAAAPPLGRAAHLTTRFPRLHTTAGQLYHGRHRRQLLAMVYTVVAHESPDLRPAAEELAWVADLGEETAVDITCAALDRGARLLLDEDQPGPLRGSLPGARQTLDAVLLAAHRLPTPGSRIDFHGHTATVVGARWPRSGPPTAFEVRLDDDPRVHLVELGQEQEPASADGAAAR